MKSVYVVQAYHVGSKHGKSLALILPANVTSTWGINASTVFALRINEETKQITLQIIDKILEQQCKINPMHNGESLANYNQKSSGVQEVV
jgi:hypothetical protein